MGIRDRYEHGVFCWVDLVASDPAAACRFYGQLLAWTFAEIPVEGAPPYIMAYKGDRRVAGLFLLPADPQAQGMPPHWQSHINVADLEATLQSWQRHGGQVLEAACEILDAGRMAIGQDPTGAKVCLWQAHSHIGAGVVNEVNTYCWAELQTRGVETAAQFYAAVFGWDIATEGQSSDYITGKVKGRYNCGMFDLDRANLPAEIPAHWEAYFNVADLDVAIARVKELGGTLLMEPATIDPGRFVAVADPQGATFTLIEPTEVDD